MTLAEPRLDEATPPRARSISRPGGKRLGRGPPSWRQPSRPRRGQDDAADPRLPAVLRRPGPWGGKCATLDRSCVAKVARLEDEGATKLRDAHEQ